MAENMEHAGAHYAVQFAYDVNAWCLELSDADAVTRLPGRAFLIAVVPDEDPTQEPLIRVSSADERDVPYEVMRWFMEKVDKQVERCRSAPVESS
ncbi:hypothetical protein [Micromonospora sp. 15K316]|uniref:hypothetical protein n=1 Tax=Micromonospora sp. 15K316 TaxID=2530376 RepID=UPI001A9F9FA7|nr:hypothetical protein [Micromonospora sp. 15K316]